jgi:uncharacterized protein with HEPN domain
MAKDASPWIEDMLDGIVWIERLTEGKSFADFKADRPMRDAVERNIERISEASRHLPDTLKDAHAEIPWAQIARVGNILRHAYRRVDPVMIWEIVELDLPSPGVVLEAMRKEIEDD